MSTTVKYLIRYILVLTHIIIPFLVTPTFPESYFLYKNYALTLISSSLLFLTLFQYNTNSTKFVFTKIDILLLILFVIILLRTLFEEKYYTQATITHLIALASFYIVLRIHLTSDKYLKYYIVISLLLSLLVQCFIGILQYSNVLDSNSAYSKITGSFANSGHFASYLILIFPILLIVYLEKKIFSEKLKKVIPFLLFISVTEFVLVRSRITFIILPAIILLYFKSNIIASINPFSKRKKNLLLVLFTTLTLFLFLFIFYLKSDSSIGRMLIWKCTLTNIQSTNILFGNGPNSFPAFLADAQINFFTEKSIPSSTKEFIVADVPKHAYNDYLEIQIEYGIISLIIIATILISIIKEKSISPFYKIGQYSILSFAILSLFFYSLSLLPNILVLLTSVSFCSTFCTYRNTNHAVYIRQKPLYLILLLAFIVLIYLSSSIFSVLSNWYNFSTKNFVKGSPLEDLATSKKQIPEKFSFEIGMKLFQLGDYKKAKKILLSLSDKGSDPLLFYTLGRIYSKESNDSAIFFYKKSIYIVPNRLYPKFLLLKYHESKGDKIEALKIAYDISNTIPKINSYATQQIKLKAKEIIQKYTSQ